MAVSRPERHPRPTGPAPTGAECRKEWDPRHTRPTATRSSVPRNLTTHEDRTYNVAVLRSGQSELRFVQQGFKGLCPISYFVVRRIGRFTGISRGQWSSSQIFLVQSRVYAINLLFATVVLCWIGSGKTAKSGKGELKMDIFDECIEALRNEGEVIVLSE